MGYRCPESVPGSKAVLHGYRFIINSRGVASVVSDDKSIVEGITWHLTEDDEERLDQCEGVGKGYYEKRWLTVMASDGAETRALVYIACTNDAGKPRDGYLERIVKAAQGLGLSSDYITYLESWLNHE